MELERLLKTFRSQPKKVAEPLKEYLLHILSYAIASELRHLSDFGYSYGNKCNVSELVLVTEELDNVPYRQGTTNPDIVAAKDFLLKELKSQAGKRDVIKQVQLFRFFVNHFGSVDKMVNFALWAFRQPVSDKTGLWLVGFGGEPWLNIARHYKALKHEGGVSNIKKTLKLRHNTGSVFNKVDHLYCGGNTDWIKP